MLKQIYHSLAVNYCKDASLIEKYWKEIEENYSSSGRHYHNLQHLENLYNELKGCKHLIEHWDTLLFSLFYHDIIYNTLNNNNEEKSAELAVERILQLGCGKEIAEKSRNLILATKSHITTADNDINLFTDADLSILGQSSDIYLQYAKQIRQEYSFYPDVLYNTGRRKVLQHFLEMEFVFKTAFFREKYELHARKNIVQELDLLQ